MSVRVFTHLVGIAAVTLACQALCVGNLVAETVDTVVCCLELCFQGRLLVERRIVFGQQRFVGLDQLLVAVLVGRAHSVELFQACQQLRRRQCVVRWSLAAYGDPD